MARPALRVTFVLAGIAAFGVLPASTGASSAQTNLTRFQNVRICAYENFSRRLNTCTRNQNGQTLSTSRIACSTTVRTTVAVATIHAQWTYAGVKLSIFKLKEDAGSRVWIDWNGGGSFPMPGGRYVCRFSAPDGKTAAAFVNSSGPRGPIVNTAICDARNARRYGTSKSFYVCQRDEDGTTIPIGSSIVCNGVYPTSHHRYKTQIVDDAGADVTPPSEGTLAEPLLQTQKRFGPINAAGRYRCRFSLDGKVVTEKSILVQ